MAEKPDDHDSRHTDAGEGRDAGRTPMFSRTGLGVFVLIIVVEAAAFGLLFFVGRDSNPEALASASGGGVSDGGTLIATEVDHDALDRIQPYIIELGELTVYPKSSESGAPYRITSEVKVVISKKLGATLFGEGTKDTPLVKLMKLNIRQVISQMLEEYALRILDNSAREAFQQETKNRLNNAQVEGDREMLEVLRILRGHVRQVVVDRLEQSSF